MATGTRDRFGPQTPIVEAMLDRAARLSEHEAEAIWTKHLAERKREEQFTASLEAVVDASHVHDRTTAMKLAESVGRDAVTVFRDTAQGRAIGGYVGRLAEALVISDLVDAPSIAPLAQPWLEVIGPLTDEASAGRRVR